VSEEIKHLALAAADIAVSLVDNPQETFGLAVAEAMAAGLPSVVSDASPGPLEMVNDGEHGLVVPTENHRAFAEALQRLMGDPELRVRCGEAARTKLRNLDWPVVEPHWRSVLALPAR